VWHLTVWNLFCGQSNLLITQSTRHKVITSSWVREVVSRVWIPNRSANNPQELSTPVNLPRNDRPTPLLTRASQQLSQYHPRAAHWSALAIDAALAMGRPQPGVSPVQYIVECTRPQPPSPSVIQLCVETVVDRW